MQLKLFKIIIHVVVSELTVDKERVKEICEKFSNMRYYCQVSNIAELMSRADLAISSGGMTTWERCCLGLPCLTVSLADNQNQVAAQAADYGVQVFLGEARHLSEELLVTEINKLLTRPDILKNMSQRGMQLVSGDGALQIANFLSAYAKGG